MIDKETYYALNSNFNSELQRQIKGTLPKGHIYQIGMPSNALLYAGIKNLPIEMASSTLEIKSSSDYMHNHPFGLISIYNLPSSIQQPIAVFDSEELCTNKKVILTEIINNDSNFIAIIDIRKSRGRHINEINSIISIYPKDSAVRIAKWFDSTNKAGLNLDVELCKWADTKKALSWLANHSSDVSAVGLSTKRIANVINKFKDYQFFDENFQKNLGDCTEKEISYGHTRPAYYRARTEAIADHIGHFGEQGKKWLQNGFIADDMKEDFDVFINDRIYGKSNEPLTFTELTTYNTWYEMHPEKVAGKIAGGTSMYFPVIVKGTRADIDKMFAQNLQSNNNDDAESKRKRAKALMLKMKMAKAKLEIN